MLRRPDSHLTRSQGHSNLQTQQESLPSSCCSIRERFEATGSSSSSSYWAGNSFQGSCLHPKGEALPLNRTSLSSQSLR